MSRTLVVTDAISAALWGILHTAPYTLSEVVVIALKKAIEGSTEVGGGGGSGPVIPPLPYGGGTGGITPPAVTWPQYVKVKNGATMQVFAPLNPLYEAQQSSVMFGGPGRSVFEPSNGQRCTPPQPLRSPAGFPLLYAIGSGGVPVGMPRVGFGETTYAYDEEILEWLARRPGYEASLLATKDNAWQAVFDRMARPTVQEAEVVIDPVIETVPGNAP